MFTLTLVDFEYETSVSIWEFEMMIVLKFQFVTRLNYRNTNETEIINELSHINLFKNIAISNLNNSSFDLT
jgi:hypothetical protein